MSINRAVTQCVVDTAYDCLKLIVIISARQCDSARRHITRPPLDYFRLSADKRMLFGGLSNYSGLEPRDLESTIRKKMEKVFPQLTGIEIEYGWSGQMGIGLNRMPQLGRLAKNVLYIQACSGHGVAPSHIMSRITAEAISGAAQRFDVLSSIHHWPFPGGKLLRRPALAIGMLYYKMLDEF
ncbi:MAG: FAD-binding oxidoreductase [Gammaproteobacteria bacterium]|nr:FAD-binding oxidoreductase [Gammaproteobacteria bacterium]